jgi:hypothetical protein
MPKRDRRHNGTPASADLLTPSYFQPPPAQSNANGSSTLRGALFFGATFALVVDVSRIDEKSRAATRSSDDFVTLEAINQWVIASDVMGSPRVRPARWKYRRTAIFVRKLALLPMTG